MNEDECPNGHSHCQHLILSTSETVPIIDGSVPLGQYQRIFLVELDDQKDEARGPGPDSRGLRPLGLDCLSQAGLGHGR